SRAYITSILYRPFDIRYTYYTGKSRGFICMPRNDVMHHMLVGKNLGLITTRQTRYTWGVRATNLIIGHKSLAAYDTNTIIPLYLYPDPKQKSLFGTDTSSNVPGDRRPNLSLAFIEDFSTKLAMQFIPDGKGDLQQTFGPEDIFNY